MRTYRNRCLIQDKPKRPPPPYYDTIAGEPPLPEIIIETDDEAEPEEKNLLELVVEKKARIDAVLFNAAATLIVAGRTGDWADGADMAAEALDSGKAKNLLENWIAMAA